MGDDSCILCRIGVGDVGVAKLYEDDLVFAMDVPSDVPFYLGPVHYLVIPHEHVPSAVYLTDDHAALAGRLFTVAANVAREKGIADRRVSLNHRRRPRRQSDSLPLPLALHRRTETRRRVLTQSWAAC
jgi:diadenosine tetraphosphate (Ap4A) HIT family hydrolase